MKNVMYKAVAVLFAVAVTVAIGFVASVREKKTYNRPYTVSEEVTTVETEEIETEQVFEEDIIVEQTFDEVTTYENVEMQTWDDLKQFT